MAAVHLTTRTRGRSDTVADFDALFVPGARSFSIWTARGERVFDSGSDFESITANLLPAAFNSNSGEQPSRDTRSDNKGPEPEGLVLGEHLGRTVFRMAHDEAAHAHGFQVLQGIQRRLALARGGGGGIEIDDVRTQSLCSDVE